MKMGKILYIVWVLCLLPVVAFAQGRQAESPAVNISGTVVDGADGSPVEQATVRLLNVKDSTLVRGVASLKDGGFTLKRVRTGNYLLTVSFVGYETLYQPLRVTGKVDPVQVGRLVLADGSVVLGEALVVGKAPEVVVRGDTVEYNADSYKVAEGSMLEDLLKKMPGVEVDSEGKVTVNGKEIKKIMVDGKEFFSSDPKVASKNLPSKMIEKVQVLDKKSDLEKMTGFDDGEEETVINLTVKPEMKRGWFGNAFAGYGSRERYEGNAMVNRFVGNDQITLMGGANNTNNMGFSDLASSMFSGMRGGGRRGGMGAGSGITSSGNGGLNVSKELQGGKLLLNGNARYSHSSNEASSKSNQLNILPGDSSYTETDRVGSRTKNDNIGFDFYTEWKPDTLTQLSFRPGFSYSTSRSNDGSEAVSIGERGDTINTSLSRNSSEGNGYNLDASLDFSRKLNSRGRVLSFSLSGSLGDSYNEGFNYSDIHYYRKGEGTRDQLTDLKSRYDNNNYNYRAYLSWVEPLGRNNFLQFTYSFSQSRQESLRNSLSRDEAGEYSRLDTANSKSYRNDFTSQRASISFKSQREKFYYTLGLNLDPSNSRSESFVGDTTLSTINQRVVNLSPMARFNYRFGKNTNLSLYYNGRTSQPSMSQLQPVADVSDPLNIRVGNPDLNPRYTNNLMVSFQRFNPEQQRSFMLFANMNYTINDIVTYMTYNENGGRTTTYKNVNGNYNANLRALLNTPFRNKKFSFNSSTMAMFSNNNGFINGTKNSNRNLTLNERTGLDYRSDLFDVGIDGNFQYIRAANTLQSQQDQNTFNFGAGGYTTFYLPLGFKLESDVSWSSNAGYADGFKQNEVLWNAAASKTFLKNNQGTLRFKIYDILQQRSNISRSITASSTTDTEYNTLNSYFMFHFIYRFSIFKGGGSPQDVRPQGRNRGMNRGMRMHRSRF